MKEQETCPLEGLTPREVQALKRAAAKEIEKEHIERAKWLITSCRVDVRQLSEHMGLMDLSFSSPSFAEYVRSAASLRVAAGELLRHLQELQKGGAL